MENYLAFNLLDNKFLSFFSDFSYVVYGILSLVFSALFIVLLLITYKKLRKKFPLAVNCWFCNSNTSVPYELSNAWECPHCKQYNGFNKDGDYNKIIPEQYNYKLNEPNFKTLRSSLEHVGTNAQNNGLCKSCNINQQLKIQQLALFVPLNEDDYFEEIEEYREKLERAYRLCSKCETTVQETLERQEYNLLQNRLNNHKCEASSQKSTILTKLDGNNLIIFMKKNGILGLKVIQIVSAILLFLAILIHYETENQFLKGALPDLTVLDPLLPVLKVLLHYKDKIYGFKSELSFVGLTSCFLLAATENQFEKNCFIALSWGFLQLSLWGTYTGLQVLMSGICLFLNVQGKQKKFIYLNKKSLPKRSGFQPAKQVFPERCNILGYESRTPSPSKMSNIAAPVEEVFDVLESKKEPKQKITNVSGGEEKKFTKQNESELESLPNEEKETKSVNISPPRKSFPPAETERNYGEPNGPGNEVDNILNGLQLGGKQKKSKKPPNFLFTKVNYSDVKNSSSIIKPAKFIKNINSTSWTDSNECNSRSSTPSSGYFSQNPEKAEPIRYDFPKSLTPISVNSFGRPSPSHYYDYYDGNHGFFNNINCYPPGCVPFQQFPGPMGHTTIYTCTRPTNFPFPFSPYQGFPSHKFSPSSPRLSDSSDSENLFQESCKRFARNSRWLKLKSILYYFSIFLNFTTLLSLVYFTSSGFVSVDWKLPKLNFIV